MNEKKKNNQRGQTLVLVALAMIALLAMLALVLDGGNTFITRRQMQNAADAGALAGARALCIRPTYGCSTTASDETCAEFFAEQYATVHNSAEAAQARADEDSRTVVVTATRDINTFFAHFIGHDEIPVEAVAEAGCFNPTEGDSVLPVGWACRPPIPGMSDSPDCQEQWLEYPGELNDRLANPPTDGDPVHDELYIVMDSDSLPEDIENPCSLLPTDPDYIDCDLDDDGDYDLLANGGRSWLDLDGGAESGSEGSQELADWIRNGFDDTIEAHMWVGDQTGTATNVFQAAATRVGDFVLVPVYDAFCDGPDPRYDCPDKWHADQDTTVDINGGNYSYHLITFVVFYITCVDSPGVPGPPCPGAQWARDLNNIHGAGSFKSIEGYFINRYVPNAGGGSGGGVDTGVYTIRLTR